MTTSLTIEQIYDEHYMQSYRFVKSIVRSDEASKDIVSEAMLELWEAMTNSEVNSPLSLLFVILKNKSLNYLKHEQVKTRAMNNIQNYLLDDVSYRISSLESLDPKELLSVEIQEIISKSLSQLPSRTASIFKMSRLNNNSAQEIADVFGITVKGVEYHIAVAIKYLRTSLKDYLSIILLLNI